MLSKQGRTLPFLGLSQGYINRTDGTFEGVTTFHCVVAGDLEFVFENGQTDVQGFLAGDEFGIKNIKGVKILLGGTFHIGFD